MVKEGTGHRHRHGPINHEVVKQAAANSHHFLRLTGCHAAPAANRFATAALLFSCSLKQCWPPLHPPAGSSPPFSVHEHNEVSNLGNSPVAHPYPL